MLRRSGTCRESEAAQRGIVKVIVREPACRSEASFDASLCTSRTFLKLFRVGAYAILKFSFWSGALQLTVSVFVPVWTSPVTSE